MVMHRTWCWGVLLLAVVPVPSQALVHDGDHLRIKPIFAVVGD